MNDRKTSIQTMQPYKHFGNAKSSMLSNESVSPITQKP